MSDKLTPYDTGAVLEPRPWGTATDVDYGRVDFDDNEGASVVTVRAVRGDDDAVTVEVDTLTDLFPIRVRVDGDAWEREGAGVMVCAECGTSAPGSYVATVTPDGDRTEVCMPCHATVSGLKEARDAVEGGA